jgi:two-component system, NtrC family, sensor kinase
MNLGRRFAGLSLRNKLLALVLLPLLVVLPLLGLGLLIWGNEALDRLLIAKIRSDLAVANGYFERVLSEVHSQTALLAESSALLGALSSDERDRAVPKLLTKAQERDALDFVNLRGPDGRLWYSSTSKVQATLESAWEAAPAERSGVEVLMPQQQHLLGETASTRVPVKLVATRGAAPTNRVVEDRALVLLSSRPVHNLKGQLLGYVQGGVLLNRNLAFIDHINEIVYPKGALPFGSQGTATLFLDDVRVSTNVRLFGSEQDERAIGTRVSQSVREAVLRDGRTWLDRAFVVNDWYVSAYQPLLDGKGQRVGMLYVGFSEAPFRWLKYSVLASIGLLFFAVMTAAAWLSLRWARHIIAPVERMSETMHRFSAGDGRARVGALPVQDELGTLAGHLDALLDNVDQKALQLQRWNAELDAKVSERTRELETAQSHLVRSEKLAAVGQLTASIAHEVNNPIAVIQGNLDLMRERLGENAHRVGRELELVDEQIERMRLIVTQLLQFARPAEYAGYVEAVDTNRLVQDSLVLAQHLLARSHIKVASSLAATGLPKANRNELQQVLVNLLVNAIHAMPDGGVLSLATQDHRRDGQAWVEVSVADTGPGLAPELLRDLFKPFVTRKKDGTGLGLWISRNIVDRYGGDLRVAPRSDGSAGAVFSVWLRVDPA